MNLKRIKSALYVSGNCVTIFLNHRGFSFSLYFSEFLKPYVFIKDLVPKQGNTSKKIISE